MSLWNLDLDRFNETDFLMEQYEKREEWQPKENRMSNLAEQYPKEQERMRDLIEEYKSIGPAGRFGLAILKDILRRADEAAATQDTVAMIQCFKEMQGCE